MQLAKPYSLNLRGRLTEISSPKVMGIVNVTPDSFYAQSRKQTAREIGEQVNKMLDEGADMIDVGAYSSRPGASDVSPEEEMNRLARALDIIREQHPEVIVSVDTFRAKVAQECVERYGADIINDISGGDLDPEMFETAAALNVPYILMHMKGTPQDMQKAPCYNHLMSEMLQYFAERIDRLHLLGLNDIILDPGFGFAKTLGHNYQLMKHLSELHTLGLPLLAGISRKSMVYRLLDSTPQEALNGTTVLNTLALVQGASILRVHDVKAACEAVKIVETCLQSE
ncbi:MAG: dihydropteroate synthase [Bacteroidaceae bacterium]|nr:dihydropteroate synthase [Bacteroidaceae bacterium]